VVGESVVLVAEGFRAVSVVRGSATLSISGEEVAITPRDHFGIPAGHAHGGSRRTTRSARRHDRTVSRAIALKAASGRRGSRTARRFRAATFPETA